MKTILVVDDDYELVESMRAYLQCEGYRVVTEDNGKHGLARLKRERPDLILTDLVMPSVGGGDLVKAIHDTATMSSLPVIIMSSAPLSQAVEDGMYAVDAFLEKPFRCEDLLAQVVSLIGVGEATERLSRDVV